MSNRPDPVRHVAAWLPAVRWATCLALWTAVTGAALLPQLNLSLRAIAPFGLAAAVCPTLVTVLAQRHERVPPVVLGLSLCADAASLTGLLDITGGPFNPFIVMFVKPADGDQIVAVFDGVMPDEGADVPSLARVEWEHIQRVLTDCAGNLSRAARSLRIHCRSLQRKLAKNPSGS